MYLRASEGCRWKEGKGEGGVRRQNKALGDASGWKYTHLCFDNKPYSLECARRTFVALEGKEFMGQG